MTLAWKTTGPQRRAEVKFSLLVIGVVAATLLVTEAILQVRNLSTNVDVQHQGFDWDKFAVTMMTNDAQEGFARFVPGAVFDDFEVNSIGLRGPEVAIPKPAKTLRLAFLGDSVVLGASLPLKDTLPDLVSKYVQKNFPECAVDYITIAGPEYSFNALEVLLTELKPMTEPDAYILLAGAFFETLRELEKSERPFPLYLRQVSKPVFEPLLWKKITYRYEVAKSKIDFEKEVDLYDRIDTAKFAATFRSLISPLVDLIDDTPVAIVTYRGQERDWMNRDQLQEYFELPLGRTNGLSIDGMIKLRAILRGELDHIAKELHWLQSDPISSIAVNSASYADRIHLTAQGEQLIAESIANTVTDAIKYHGASCGIVGSDVENGTSDARAPYSSDL